MQKQLPKGYLFLHNIGKKNNIGSIVRSACAFGLKQVVYVSNRPDKSKKMKAMKQFHCFGNHGTFKQIKFNGFDSLKQAKEYLNTNNIKVCGIQIGQNSKPIHQHPFSGNTAFFLGNEGTGILPVHKQLCDYFVYIPQYTDKTASLNVGVAAGIVFHHFALWAGYQQAQLYGQKYQNQQQQEIAENQKAQDQNDEQQNANNQGNKIEIKKNSDKKIQQQKHSTNQVK